MSLYRRKDSPYWWAQIYVAGRMVAFSTRKRTKTEALLVERNEAARIAETHRVTDAGKFTLATLAAKFLLWKEADGRSLGTVTMLTKHIKLHIIPHFGASRDIRLLDEAALEGYKTERAAKVSASTVSKELTTLRQALKYAHDVLRVIPRVPTCRNPIQRWEPKWRLLTAKQIGAILGELAKLQGRAREALPYFALMANTGMRGGELAKLTWAMVDLAARAISLPGQITKTRRSRTVPLNAPAMAALHSVAARCKVGRVFIAGHHYTAWRAACKECGLDGTRPHDLRHSYASLLHAAGVSGVEIRDILGHITLAMESHYAHSYLPRLHAAVNSVEVATGRKNSVVQKRSDQGQNVAENAAKCKNGGDAKNKASATVK